MYAAPEDLKKRLGDVFASLYIRLDGTLMDEEIASDLAAADGEINGMIGTRYVVPVVSDTAKDLLKNWAVTLAEELAWSRSGKSELPKNLQSRLDTVRKQLERIAEGKMVLPGAVQDNVTGGGSVVCVEIDDPVFGRKNMGGY
ncbi:MAG: DUF1320 family protein [Lentisphaeria bacterium]|nr:DUF1320 family protein [Lentisphaeria bacterium]